MKLNKIVLLVLAVSVLVVGCDNRSQHHTRVPHKQVKVHYVNGHYCYHDDNLIWYYLMWNNSGTTTYYSSPAPAIINYSQINGATWVKGNPPSPEQTKIAELEEQQNSPNEQEIDITANQTEEPVLDFPENNSLDSMEGVPDSNGSESSSMSDSSESSTSSDAGSGGDSGGGDGGGGGE